MHQQHRPHKIAILHGPPQALPQEEDQKHPARRQPAAMVRTATREYDADVVSYLNAAVSAFHCVAEVRRRLLAAAFEELDERRPWAGAVKPGGSYFVTRNGSSLLAFAVGGAFDEATSGAIASCYCGTQALIEAAGSLAADASLRMLTMFDHEEDVLSRAYAALEGRDEHAFVARSLQISSDMAHGVHPNYASADHGPKLQGGLVIKHNANQRYATNAVGAVMVREFAARADVPTQDFAVKADSGCGTTIGPITAALTGMRTVDAVDVDGPDPFWADPGKGWASAKLQC
ncbi:aminopeptidase [Aureococcus anophagefferens]|nr:aminopeptidase [Aureococcus anophagefferens]